MKNNEADFLSPLCKSLTPYEAGEQPAENQSFIKLNTNEAPYPPSLAVRKAIVRYDCDLLKLYPSPENYALKAALADTFNVPQECVFVGNGSDEILSFCIPAFAGNGKVAYADITYSFYPSICSLFSAQSVIVPLEEDLTLNGNDYLSLNADVILIANPNAPTSKALPLSEIEKIVAANRGKTVIIDEAYADFAEESAIPLLKKYDNLLIVRTFSKSYALAGIRLGYALGSYRLIEALNRVKNCFNSYTVNSLSEAAGVAALGDIDYYQSNINALIQTREYFAREIRAMGMECPDSSTNFVFAKYNGFDGKQLYLSLKERGILVRHFNKDKIRDRIRISIGSLNDMSMLLNALQEILP